MLTPSPPILTQHESGSAPGFLEASINRHNDTAWDKPGSCHFIHGFLFFPSRGRKSSTLKSLRSRAPDLQLWFADLRAGIFSLIPDWIERFPYTAAIAAAYPISTFATGCFFSRTHFTNERQAISVGSSPAVSNRVPGPRYGISPWARYDAPVVSPFFNTSDGVTTAWVTSAS